MSSLCQPWFTSVFWWNIIIYHFNTKLLTFRSTMWISTMSLFVRRKCRQPSARCTECWAREACWSLWPSAGTSRFWLRVYKKSRYHDFDFEKGIYTSYLSNIILYWWCIWTSIDVITLDGKRWLEGLNLGLNRWSVVDDIAGLLWCAMCAKDTERLSDLEGRTWPGRTSSQRISPVAFALYVMQHVHSNNVVW